MELPQYAFISLKTINLQENQSAQKLLFKELHGEKKKNEKLAE